MNATMLMEKLSAIGLSYHLLQGHGGPVLILERGGRIIGIHPSRDADNLLWVNPLLENSEMAGQSFGTGQEWNIGGDRTWVSPEIIYNVRNVEAFWDSYIVQPSIDPGQFRCLTRESDEVHIVQHVCLHTYRPLGQIEFRMEKAFRTIDDPLTSIYPDHLDESYSFNGFELDVTLTLQHNPAGVPLSAWNIMQVPAGGQVFIPTYGTAAITDFFEPTGSSHLSVGQGASVFRLDARERHKISVKAPYLTGRAGYIRRTDDQVWTLIIRNFSVNPSGSYRDVSVYNLQDRGHCLQCYNDDGSLGAFGEIEYHSPVITSAGSRFQDRNQVWAYQGSLQIIHRITKTLLGIVI